MCLKRCLESGGSREEQTLLDPYIDSRPESGPSFLGSSPAISYM